MNTHFYTATKYAVTALTEGTRQELRMIGSRVRANQVSPGFVATDFFGCVSSDPDYLAKMTKIAQDRANKGVFYIKFLIKPIK